MTYNLFLIQNQTPPKLFSSLHKFKLNHLCTKNTPKIADKIEKYSTVYNTYI